MKSNIIVIMAIAIFAICGCGICTENSRRPMVIPAGQSAYGIRVEDNVRYTLDDRVNVSHGGKAIVTEARVVALSSDDVITIMVTQDQVFLLEAAAALDGKFTVTKNSGDN